MEACKGVVEPKKSVVQVYFPHRGMGWAYYNDSFDLKVGDFVYPVRACETVVGLSEAYCKKALEEGENDIAVYFLEIYCGLTEDEEAVAMLEQLIDKNNKE